MARRWKTKHIVIAVITAGVLGYVAYGPLHVFMVAKRNGFLDKTEQHDYTGDSIANLKAIAGAVKKYHESEGQFPTNEHWMDAVMKYLNSADLKAGEAEKKLHDPTLAASEYGYAMNSAIAGKYVDDLPEKGKTIIVYLSSQKSKDAVGDPKTDSRAKEIVGVDFAGNLVELAKK